MKICSKLQTCLSFFTKFPLPKTNSSLPELKECIGYFPLVGFIVGIISWLLSFLVDQYFPSLGAPFFFIMLILITGGLHLDGLADSADGLFFSGTPARRIEIMRDSSLGVYGVTALVVTLILKWEFINLIWGSPVSWCLAMMPFLGKIGILFLLGIGCSPSNQGSYSRDLANSTSLKPFLVWISVALALCFTISFSSHWIFLILATTLTTQWAYRKISEVTGDLCGFVNEVYEVFFLVALAQL